MHHQGIISPPRRDLRSGVAFDRSSPRLRGGRLAGYISIRLSRRSSAPPLLAGFRRAQLAGNTFLVIRNPPKASNSSKDN
jgi:hypothetical protein